MGYLGWLGLFCCRNRNADTDADGNVNRTMPQSPASRSSVVMVTIVLCYRTHLIRMIIRILSPLKRSLNAVQAEYLGYLHGPIETYTLNIVCRCRWFSKLFKCFPFWCSFSSEVVNFWSDIILKFYGMCVHYVIIYKYQYKPKYEYATANLIRTDDTHFVASSSTSGKYLVTHLAAGLLSENFVWLVTQAIFSIWFSRWLSDKLCMKHFGRKRYTHCASFDSSQYIFIQSFALSFLSWKV